MAVTDIAKLYDNHTTIEEKLEIIEGITRRRLTIMLGINNPSLIPEQLDYVVDLEYRDWETDRKSVV